MFDNADKQVGGNKPNIRRAGFEHDQLVLVRRYQ